MVEKYIEDVPPVINLQKSVAEEIENPYKQMDGDVDDYDYTSDTITHSLLMNFFRSLGTQSNHISK